MSSSALPAPVPGSPLSGPSGNGTAVSAAGRAEVHAAEVETIVRAKLDLTAPVELPAEGRLSASTLAVLAGAAGVVAILLGGWAFVSGMRDDGAGGVTGGAASSSYAEAVALLAAPTAEQLPLRGSVGRLILVVRPTGSAALVLNGLGEADSAWTYQAWVSAPGAITPRSAALFSGREAVVPLAVPVPPGATVAVTLEPEAGSLAPTRTPKLLVDRPA